MSGILRQAEKGKVVRLNDGREGTVIDKRGRTVVVELDGEGESQLADNTPCYIF